MQSISGKQNGRFQPFHERPPYCFRERFELVVGQVEAVESRQNGSEVADELVDGVVGEVKSSEPVERAKVGGGERAQLVQAEVQLFDV